MTDRDPGRLLLQRGRALMDFCVYVGQRFSHNGGSETAASLTYTTLFAVVPLMTVAFSLLSAVEALAGVDEVIRDFVFDNFLPSTGAMVEEKLSEFSQQARQLTVAGFAFLIVTAYMMLMNIERAFNRIWSVREARQGLGKFLLYWAVLTLSPLLLGSGFAISSYLFSLPLVAGVDQFGLRENLLRILPFLSSAGAFTVLYAAVPNTRVPLRDALLGGFVSMLAFEGAKHGFAFVMKRTAVEVIYGTFAAVPLFLIWLYLTWTIVLLGAELVHALGVRRYDVVDEHRGTLSLTLEFLQRVHRQHRAGGGLPDILALPVLQRLGPDLLPRVLEGLEQADIVRRDHDSNWLPGRDFGELTVEDVFRALPGYRLDGMARHDDEPPWQARLRGRLEDLQRIRSDALGISLEELFLSTDEEDDSESSVASLEAVDRRLA